MDSEDFEYDAFLSYAHEDERVVEWLQQVLERTWVPGKRRRVIFLDKNRLDAGLLSERLRTALRKSRFLVVCCSSNEAASKWVNQEIDEFAHARAPAPTHATSAILACRVVATPDSLPPALRWVCAELEDELFVPDVSAARTARSRAEWRSARHEAFAILAPLVGLADREAVYARVRKTRLIATVVVSALVMLGGAMWQWTRTDSYQMRRIALMGPEVLRSAESFSSVRFLEALAVTQHRAVAIATARALPDSDMRIFAVASVAGSLAKTGERSTSRQLADEARSQVTQVPDGRMKSMVLDALAKTFLELGNPARAEQLAAMDADVGLTIDHPVLRAQVLCEALQTLTSVGPSARARQTAGDLAAAAREERTGAADRAYDLACASIGTNDASARSALADEAFVAALGITPLRARVETLSNIAQLFGSNGLADATGDAAKTALKAAKELPNGTRAFILVTHVLPALAAARLDDAEQLATQLALETALAGDDADARARNVSSVLRWLKRRKPDSELVALAQRARDEVAAVSDSDRKIDVLSQVAHEIAKAQLPIAASIAREVLAGVPLHTDDRGRSVAYAQIASAFAELRLFREARLAADRCGSSTDRLEAYAAILRSFAMGTGPRRATRAAVEREGILSTELSTGMPIGRPQPSSAGTAPEGSAELRLSAVTEHTSILGSSSVDGLFI